MEDHVELKTVLQELHRLSGLRLSIHDTSFREIEAWPQEKCAFCAELQRNPKAYERCLQCDAQAQEKAQSTQQLYQYRCVFGLSEVVAPIYCFGSLIGYLMMGQTLCAPAGNREEIRRLAMPYAVDPAALSEKLDAMALRDPEAMLSCARIMDICAKYISLSNRMNPGQGDLATAARAYIYEHYDQPLTIDRLASQFFCSRTTVIHAFQNRYGETINECITRVRLERACERLTQSRTGVQEIAAECGFASANYFSKVFMKVYQQTPTEYRRAKWKGDNALGFSKMQSC